MAVNMGISYSMAFPLAYKYRNLFSPCPSHLPSPRFPRSNLTRLRVVPAPYSALQLVSDVRHPLTDG